MGISVKGAKRVSDRQGERALGERGMGNALGLFGKGVLGWRVERPRELLRGDLPAAVTRQLTSSSIFSQTREKTFATSVIRMF